MANNNNEIETESIDFMERLMDECVALRQEVLAKELLMGCLVQKLGGSVTITKQDIKDLAFVTGDAREVYQNGGQCLTRTKNADDSVTFVVKVGASQSSGKVM